MRGEQNADMQTRPTETLESLCLCGLLPSLTAETPAALVKGLAALMELGFPVVEVEAVSGWLSEPQQSVLSQCLGMAVGVRTTSRANALAWLARGAAWATCPSGLAAQDGEQTGVHEVLMLPHGEVQESTAAQLMQSPSLLAMRRQVHVTVDNAQAVAEEMHAQWVASLGFTLMHIGINAEGAAEASGIAGQFASLLGAAVIDGAQNSFAGTLVEVMKSGGRGLHGHIGFGTSDLPRAMYYAERKGFAFDPASRKNDAEGNAILYYLAQDIAGFAVHLLQR